jgi:cytochrome c oxidase subunit 2
MAVALFVGLNSASSLGNTVTFLIPGAAMVCAIALIASPALADGVQVVKISAKKFEFTPSQITVKKNVPVVLQLTSQDRTHGIAISALNLRADIPPGKVTELKFTPQKSGDLKFYCDVFCGEGHDNMEGTIKVVD